MNERYTDLESRIQEIHAIKQQIGFASQKKLPFEGKVDIDLERLSLLIDPTMTTQLYSSRKWVGPILTWMRRSLIRVFYFVFRMDFSRVIELHQNVWIMAYQFKDMQTRLNALETELRDMKNSHDKKTN